MATWCFLSPTFPSSLFPTHLCLPLRTEPSRAAGTTPPPSPWGLLSGPPRRLPCSTASLFARSWLGKKGLTKHAWLVALLSSAYFSFAFTLRKCHCACLCLWVKPFVAGARVLFFVLFSFHLPPPPNLLISRPDFTACALLLPTGPKKVAM